MADPWCAQNIWPAKKAALMDEITTPIALPLKLVAHGLLTKAHFEPEIEDDFTPK